MVDFHAGFEPAPPKFEVVKGKEFSTNQTFRLTNTTTVTTTTRPRPPLPPPPVIGRPQLSPKKGSKQKKKLSSMFNGRESKRRKRVLKYKFYAVESKVRSSFSKGIRWIKRKCSQIANEF